MSEPGLKGFAGLLKADLLRRAGRLDEAKAEIDAAAKTQPPPPEREVLDALVPILTGQKKYADALAAIRASHLEPPAKELAAVAVELAKVTGQPGGPERLAAEQEFFRQMKELLARKGNEGRLALSELARSGIDPDPANEPAVWDMMAEAADFRGDPERAAALEQQAAGRAEALGHPEAAAGFRLRGGGFLFRAGKYAEADSLLSRVIEDPRAGAARARAGMLRGLARGRALAMGLPGSTPAAYAQALQAQIRDFPKDPATDEARWLLGVLMRASGERDKALALWSEISRGSPRWLDSRLALAESRRSALESALATDERHALAESYQKAQDALAQSQRAGARRERRDRAVAGRGATLPRTPRRQAPARRFHARTGRPDEPHSPPTVSGAARRHDRAGPARTLRRGRARSPDPPLVEGSLLPRRLPRRGPVTRSLRLDGRHQPAPAPPWHGHATADSTPGPGSRTTRNGPRISAPS